MRDILRDFGAIIVYRYIVNYMKKKVNSRIQKFYSIIDAASLRNPTILNDLNSVKVTVQHEPESSTSPYHFKKCFLQFYRHI